MGLMSYRTYRTTPEGISVPLKSNNMRIEVSYVNKNKRKRQKCEESSGHSGQLRPKDNSP